MKQNEIDSHHASLRCQRLAGISAICSREWKRVSSATALEFIYLHDERPHSKDCPKKSEKSLQSQQTLD